MCVWRINPRAVVVGARRNVEESMARHEHEHDKTVETVGDYVSTMYMSENT